MLTIQTRELKNWAKCSCCGEQKRTCEKMLFVHDTDKGKDVRGERYCLNCEKYARMNNDISDAQEDDGEAHLRRMEQFAAYQAEGCPSRFFDDEQAGYL